MAKQASLTINNDSRLSYVSQCSLDENQDDEDVPASNRSNGDEDKPTFVQRLSEYFEFVSSHKVKEKQKNGTLRSRTVAKLRCLLCRNGIGKNTGNKNASKSVKVKPVETTINGQSVSAFKRHLVRHHEGNFNPNIFEDRNGSNVNSDSDGDDLQKSILPSVIGITGSNSRRRVGLDLEKYGRNSTKQKEFEKSLLNMVVLDSLPLSIVEMDGFNLFVRSMDPRFTIPSRRTIGRSLDECYQMLMGHLNVEIRDMHCGTGHLLFDMWSSRNKMSIIGVQVRFIKEWKVQQLILGFQHFPGTHDGKSIKKKLTDMLLETFKLPLYYFATVTADNASSIIAAFRKNDFDGSNKTVATVVNPSSQSPKTAGASSSNPVQSKTRISIPELENSTSITNCESMPMDLSDDELVTEESILHDLVIDNELMMSFEEALGEMTSPTQTFPIQRNSCLAHLLQLAIKDALKQSIVADMAKKVNHIITWFHKSNIHYTKLKLLTKIGLKKPCETRWNSFYHCLSRLCEEVLEAANENEGENNQVSVAHKINEVIREAKKTAKKQEKIPHPLSEEDLCIIRILCSLLEPWAILTDDWQADGVTSSIVLVGLLDAFKEYDEVVIDENLEKRDEITLFRTTLRRSVITRFGTAKEKGQKIKDAYGNEKKIVAVDVFNDENYILATILDPRFKTFPFDDPGKNPGFPNGWPTVDEAKKLLRGKYLELMDLSHANEPVVVSSTQSSEHSSMTSAEGTSCSDSTSDASENVQASQNVLNESALRPPPKKKQRKTFQCLASRPTTSKPKKDVDQVDLYFELEIVQPSENPLLFWRLNSDRLHKLTELAKRYLGMPATSASVERLFSIAGSIIRARRASMKIETAEKLLCYQEWLKKGLRK